MTISIPGMAVTNRVSATAQYTSHMLDLGDSAYVSPMRVTFTAETGLNADLDQYRSDLENAIGNFNGAIAVGIDNSLLLHFLEPKQGDTIQTYFAKIKENLDAHTANNGGLGYVGIGGPNAVPSITKSGIRIFVTKKEPSLEYLAAIVLKLLPWATLVRATTDTGMSATVQWQEQQNLL